MPLLDKFSFVPSGDLPAQPGIVIVCCPTSDPAKQTFKVIAVMDAGDIRQVVAKNGPYWASQCNAYLQYQVRVIHDASERRALVQKIQEHYTMSS